VLCLFLDRAGGTFTRSERIQPSSLLAKELASPTSSGASVDLGGVHREVEIRFLVKVLDSFLRIADYGGIQFTVLRSLAATKFGSKAFVIVFVRPNEAGSPRVEFGGEGGWQYPAGFLLK